MINWNGDKQIRVNVFLFKKIKVLFAKNYMQEVYKNRILMRILWSKKR